MRQAMWRNGIFLGIMLLVLALWAPVGQANLPDSFGDWRTRSFQPVTENLLAQIAGNDALVLHEYGFLSGQQREYSSGDAMITVTLWQMRDATGSYGLLTFFRQPEMTEVEGEGTILRGRGRLLARRGAYVLDARGAGIDSLSVDEAGMLFGQIPSPGRGEDVLPPLPGYLPEQDLVASSTKFVMGPVALGRSGVELPASLLGFDLGAEVVLAQYRPSGNTVRLLLVSYATPQLAAKQLRGFEEARSAAPWSHVQMRRVGSLLAFVLDEAREEQAQPLFDGIRYESFVTWNEYVPGPRDNVGALLTGAFLLAGFVLLVTLVAGISFGGVRYLAKKFLPWEVFDRPSAMEIIKLNISEK